MVSIQNIVAAGSLGREVDLDAIARDIDATEVRFDLETHPAVYLRFRGGGPLVTLYRTGNYHVSGAKSREALQQARNQLLQALSALSIPIDRTSPFGVRNYVCTDDYGQPLNLNALAVGLGLETIEYEPEQFPGLVYRPPGQSSTVMLFGTGKMVVTGAQELSEVQETVQQVRQTLDEFGD